MHAYRAQIGICSLVVLFGAACGGSSEVDAGAQDTGAQRVDTGVVPDTGVPPDTGVQPDTGVDTDSGVLPDTGVATDSGVQPDTGIQPDTGVEPDTGVQPDSGVEPDTGVQPDTGIEPDSGVQPDTGVTPDAGLDAAVPDAGPDGGMADAGLDAGQTDTGVMPDAGTPGVCTDGEEGCLCGFGLTCNDPLLTCLNVSGTNVPPANRVNICVRQCILDVQCANSVVGNTLCRNINATDKACVSQERGEAEQIDLSRRRGGVMTGCANNLFAFPPFAGSGLNSLEDDQASCGRPCNPGALPGTAQACGTLYPYCNPNVLTSSSTPGVCTLRRANPGDVCSRSSVVGICDTTTSTSGNTPQSLCLGVPMDIRDPADPSPVPAAGICALTCNLAAPDCGPASDANLGAATCRPFTAANTTTGLCSNECSRWPSTCGNLGAFSTGTTCTGDLSLEAGLDFSFCRSVMPPPIPEWDWSTASGTGCLGLAGGEARCANGTYCFNDGTGLGGVCIRTCNASAAANATGCQNSPVGNTRCDDTVIGTATDGFGACARP